MTSPTDHLDHERREAAEWAERASRFSGSVRWENLSDRLSSVAALLRGAEAPRADEVRAAAQYAFEMMRNTEMWDDDDYDGHPEMRKHGTLLRDFALGGVTPRAQTTPSAEVLRDALRPLISREAVTDAALLNVADGLRDADFWGSPSPEAPSPKEVCGAHSDAYANFVECDLKRGHVGDHSWRGVGVSVSWNDLGSVSSPTSTPHEELLARSRASMGGDTSEMIDIDAAAPLVEQSPAPNAHEVIDGRGFQIRGAVEQSPSDPKSLGAASPTPKEGE